MVDRTLLRHWTQQKRAREQARLALPSRWRAAADPRAREVADVYTEALAAAKLRALPRRNP